MCGWLEEEGGVRVCCWKVVVNRCLLVLAVVVTSATSF